MTGLESRLTSRAVIAVLAAALLMACGNKEDSGETPANAEKKPRVAYVTNGVSAYWVIAEAGARAAAEKVGVDVSILMPAEGISDQKRMIEDQLTKGVQGIAVSPIDPANQLDTLNQAAGRAHLITHDSDAPLSNREAYIGMDNYAAGRMAGELVKAAMPEGGKVAIFIGRTEQDNGRRRRQGLIDEILGRSSDASRFDPPAARIQEGKWDIVGTYTDQSDRARGKANVEDVMSRYPDLGAAVGLYAYNPPLILEALKQAGKIGKIKVIGFDEADETLSGIKDGSVYGTVVQNPYMYGYKSVELLAGLVRGKAPKDLRVPDNKFIDVPARKIRKDNVDEFRAELRKNLGSR